MARTLEREARRAGIACAVAPSTPDLARVAAAVPIPVLAQHADADGAGARTGSVVAEAISAAGGRGSLLNHSERPLPPEVVGVAAARLTAAGLVPVVCAANVATARRLAEFRPPYLAVEPPELIGGSRSVSAAAPEVVRGTVEAVHEVSPSTHVLCGAGIHDRRDVALALELGSEGVLVASAVTGAADPVAALRELFAGYPRARTPRT
jgi:triosephosphate isomerase